MSASIGPSEGANLPSPSPAGWAVHVLTAAGAVLGLLALVAVMDRRPYAAVVWLVAAQILDGLDGPLARAYGLDSQPSRIDGYILDLVVDYFTCVAVPALLLHQFLGFGPWEGLVLASVVLISGGLWFSRLDMCAEDHSFRGFPAAWNLVIPTLLLLRLPSLLEAAIIAALSALSFSNVVFVHPMRVVRGRAVSIGVTVLWLVSLLALSLDEGPHRATFELHVLLSASALGFVAITMWHTRQRLDVGLADAR
ncbi:MAG: CDP-alcohol phosphatidyltransferase family protein [Acidimicrobiales bacterium]|nr:CDP-alcohol phosphatidyltransferase family protein [Acidimicrobiales bacterium]